MRKVFKFVRRVLVVSFLLLLVSFTVLIFFKEKIKETCLENLNQVVNTEVKLKDVDLTILERFPHVSLKLNHLQVKDAIEGSRDSLLVLEEAYLGLDFVEMLQGNYVINYCKLSKGYIQIRIDEEGRNNFTLFKPDTAKKDTSSFSLDIEELVLDSVQIGYLDQRVKNHHQIYARNAVCSMELEQGVETVLDIEGDFLCDHIGLDKNKFLENKHFTLDAEIGYNFETHQVRFEKSSLNIEQARFLIDGNIVAKEYNTWDLKISSPSSNIQSLVSLLPYSITKSLAGYKSKGQVYFNASINGIQSKSKSPAIGVNFGFNNTSFYHPDLKQKVTDCSLKGRFSNGKSRNAVSSSLTLDNFSGKLGKDIIKGNLSYTNFDNPYLDVTLNGQFALDAALKLYPVEQITSASGDFKANLNFKGLIKHLNDPSKAKKIKTSGDFELVNADIDLEGSQMTFRDFNGVFHFNNHDLGITKFTGKVGKSDFELKGYFKNFISYLLLEKQVLKVKALFKSDLIDLDEILSQGMVTDEESLEKKEEESGYSFRLSPYISYDLDCEINKLKIRRLKDDFIGENLKGRLSLKSQVLNYQNIKMDLAGGSVTLNGVVNAMDSMKVHVRNNTDVKNIEVNKAFYLLENFGQEFITDKNFKGVLNANAETLMNFDHQLVLDLNSIKTMAEVNIKDGALVGFAPMVDLGDFLTKKKFKRYLKSGDFSEVTFSELSNTIFIDKQVISIPQMVIKTDVASDMTIEGEHSFDNKMDYHVHFPLINYNREERLTEKGMDLDDQKRWVIYLDILGSSDDYVIDFDQTRSLGTAMQAAGNRVKQVFEEDETTLDEAGELDDESVIFEEF